jgi:uncharacterized membrane protein YphA (DoxX/SURF4 family)
MPAIAIRLVLAVLLAIHGMGHWEITRHWGQRTAADSWILGTGADGIGRVLWIATILVFLAAGIALALGLPQWRFVAVAGSIVSLAVIVLFFDPKMLIGVVVDVALLVAILAPAAADKLKSLIGV